MNLPFPADAWPGKVQKETAHFRSWGLCSPVLVMKAVFGVTLLTWGSAQRSNWCQLGFGLHLNLNIKLQSSPRSLYFVGSPGLVSAVVKPTKNKFRRELISSCSLESIVEGSGTGTRRRQLSKDDRGEVLTDLLSFLSYAVQTRLPGSQVRLNNQKIHQKHGHTPVWWRQSLNWRSCFIGNSSLCRVHKS